MWWNSNLCDEGKLSVAAIYPVPQSLPRSKELKLLLLV